MQRSFHRQQKVLLPVAEAGDSVTLNQAIAGSRKLRMITNTWEIQSSTPLPERMLLRSCPSRLFMVHLVFPRVTFDLH
jgi:hypothetical protein